MKLHSLSGIEEELRQSLERYGAPSLCLAVVDESSILYSGCFGYRDAARKLVPDLHTRYAIASVTKSMTAACLGILKEEGRVDWNTRIASCLPDFRLFDEYAGRHATVKDLLTHMTGLPRHDRVWTAKGRFQKSTEQLVQALAYLKPNKEFRSLFEYNNLMYSTASLLIERLSGQPWHEFLKERIFQPLDMENSSALPEGILNAQNRALPYMRIAPQTTGLTDYAEFDGLAGAGTVNSCLADMANYLMLHIGKGRYKGKRILTEKTMTELHWTHGIDYSTPEYKWAELPVACYGLGWTIQPYRGHLCIQHSGKINGFSSYATFLPFEKVGIVLLCNMESCFLPVTTAHRIYDRLLGEAPVDWEGRYDGEFAKAEEMLRRHNEGIFALRTEGKPMSAALEAYAGSYFHPGYGGLEVRLVSGKLMMEYNGFSYRLNHSNGDAFDANLSRGYPEEYTTAIFSADAGGQILSLAVDFEPALGEAIIFEKKRSEGNEGIYQRGH